MKKPQTMYFHYINLAIIAVLSDRYEEAIAKTLPNLIVPSIRPCLQRY